MLSLQLSVLSSCRSLFLCHLFRDVTTTDLILVCILHHLYQSMKLHPVYPSTCLSLRADLFRFLVSAPNIGSPYIKDFVNICLWIKEYFTFINCCGAEELCFCMLCYYYTYLCHYFTYMLSLPEMPSTDFSFLWVPPYPSKTDILLHILNICLLFLDTNLLEEVEIMNFYLLSFST